MGVVRRKGKWRLVKKKKGVYSITERDQERAVILTDDYSPSGELLGPAENVMAETIYVSDFKEAKRAFEDFVGRQESGVSLF